MEVKLHLLLTSALHGGKWKAMRPSSIIGDEESPGYVRVGPTAGVDAEQSKRRHPVHQCVSLSPHWMSYLESPFCVTPAILVPFYITLPRYRVPFSYLYLDREIVMLTVNLQTKTNMFNLKLLFFLAVTSCSFVYRYLGLSNKLHSVTSQKTVILAVNGAWTPHLTLSFDCSRGTEHNYCQAQG